MYIIYTHGTTVVSTPTAVYLWEGHLSTEEIMDRLEKENAYV